MLFLTIFVFILILGLLVFFHELGHFLVAKAVGIKVLEFAFGFPPRLIKKKKGDTTYSINALPLGGYVKLLGEEKQSDDPSSFNKKSVSARLLVSIAGVSMNLIFAWLLISIGFMVGMTPLVSDAKDLGGRQEPMIIVAETLADAPAQKVGIKSAMILEQGVADGEAVEFQTAQDLQDFTTQYQGREVIIKARSLENKVVSEYRLILGVGDAPLGVAIVESAKVHLGFFPALYHGERETIATTGIIFKFIGGFFKTLFAQGQLSSEGSGPVGMYVITAQAVKMGFSFVIQLTALISINLAIFNILPFPALDGGRVVFLAIEGIFRRRIIKEKIENIIHTIGFGVLIILLLAITYRDVIRLILKN